MGSAASAWSCGDLAKARRLVVKGGAHVDGVAAKPDPRDGTPARQMPVWATILTVIAMGTLPYVAFVGQNLSANPDLAIVGTWWLVTVATSLSLLGLAFRAGHQTGAWTGTVIAVSLWLAFSYPEAELGSASPAIRVTAWLTVGLVLAALVWILGRRHAFQVFVSIMAMGLLIAASITMLGAIGRVRTFGATLAQPQTLERSSLATRPSVWFVVLDGHAPTDYFHDATRYDPGPFVEFLEDEQFSVQSRATSVYPFSYLSIASTLEMDRLSETTVAPPIGPFSDIIQGHNETVETFRAAGYSYAHAHSGLWDGSTCAGVEDLCLGEDTSVVGVTANALRNSLTFVRTDRGGDPAAVAEANDPAAVVDKVVEAGLDGPIFAFIHVLNPHAPMLRAADCSIRDVPLLLGEWESGEVYADAVACLHRQLRRAVNRIIQDDPDAVIILQGDHGHRLGIDDAHESGDLITDDQWYDTFSAIRLPPRCTGLVPDDLTLPNTFRIVFSCLQDHPIPLLTDQRVVMEQS